MKEPGATGGQRREESDLCEQRQGGKCGPWRFLSRGGTQHNVTRGVKGSFCCGEKSRFGEKGPWERRWRLGFRGRWWNVDRL